MARWVGWVTYALWGLICFLVFFHLLFPYEALGRRILYTFEQKTNLVTQPSEPGRRLLGIRWGRVDITSLRYKTLPPIQIKDWVIQLRPLSLLVGRLSVVSHGTLMSGSLRTKLVMERKGYHGLGEWDGVRLDRLPLVVMEGASLSGITSGNVLWEMTGQRLGGEASLELRDGRIENVPFTGLTMPSLDLGEIRGQITLKDSTIDLKEISVAGGDLKGKLTGNVRVEYPFAKSRVACRLELGLAAHLVDRYPVMKALFENEQGQPKPLVMAIGGTLESPRISPAR
jgi:type II secretion system protein N